HVAGELAEWPLRLDLLHRHFAFDHELGAGGYLEGDRLALYHLDPRATDAARDGELLLAAARRRHQRVEGIGADVERRRHRLAAHLPLGVVDGAAAIGRTKQDAGLARALHLAAADAEVASTGVGIARHPERRKVGTGVLAGRPDRCWNFGE